MSYVSYVDRGRVPLCTTTNCTICAVKASSITADGWVNVLVGKFWIVQADHDRLCYSFSNQCGEPINTNPILFQLYSS
jgi:hypothetical protein